MRRGEADRVEEWIVASVKVPRVYLYVITRDYGFAPNPFHGFCTLATCKPLIRKNAQIGDYIIGVGMAKSLHFKHIVYYMRVCEAVTFDEYWSNERFQKKKPIVDGSLKYCYGDNIYHRENGVWIQSDSHHYGKDGATNYINLDRDTQRNRVLISYPSNWGYFGELSFLTPSKFDKIYLNRIGQWTLSDADGQEIIELLFTLPKGINGDPAKWGKASKMEKYNGID